MSSYFHLLTGEEYTGPFPTTIQGFEWVVEDGLHQYIRKETKKGDPDYKDELDRYLMVNEGVRWYDQEPDWAKASEGGQGSGNFGHLGEPGQHGGSAAGKSVSFQPSTFSEPGEKPYEFREEIDKWDDDLRRSEAINATLFGWSSMGAGGLAVIDSDGKLAAIAQVRTASRDRLRTMFGTNMPKGKYLEVLDLATREKGWGRRIMQDVVDKAAKGGMGVILRSSGQGEGFYQKLGMVQDGEEPVFWFTSEQAQEASTKKVKEVLPTVLDDDEPIQFIEVDLEMLARVKKASEKSK